ncbi:2-aminoethylphosphonate ABC transporter permease subunit [Marinactinospora thermotolerans]|uniref:2-aminoethylphosphonate transport system permease protein n=1 Tax=Marinactinospora thermotolerans DSM 45154 TaxID=1122192 RepID=A0A1T4LEN0_9ACTN|nr:2-aminoethylphosphonate ABC transporter permease subunit [Marinactinospora thermotolerans]SJZ52934.1 2-aminoethylphosphonate transport system permease protein [Marinactinospora thermotolerans DSM 45154]
MSVEAVTGAAQESPAVPAGTAPAAPARGTGRRAALWALPPLIVVADFFCYPLALVVAQSFIAETGGPTLAVWADVVTSPEFGAGVARTVLIAVGAAAGCALIGTFLALVVSFAPFPGVRLVSGLVAVLPAVPGFLIVLSFTFLYGSAGALNALLGGSLDFLYTPWGVLLAEITLFTPFVMRPLVAAFGQIPRARLDVAASLGARPWRVLWQVVLPEVRPALAAATCLVLLMAANEFGIVLFIGAKDVVTLPVLVYTWGIVTFDYPAACVVAVVNVVLSLLLYGVYRWVLSGRGKRRARVDED